MGQLVELVQAWEDFQVLHPQGNLDSFGFWLRTKNAAVTAKEFRADDKEFDKYEAQAKLSMQAGYLIGKLNKYVMVYTKPIMKKHGLHSMDDFGYLATVQWHGTITKTKACQAMLQEITTGTDIIKRLIELAFMKEVRDKIDKRQKNLQLTPKGTKVLAQLQEDFKDLPDVLGDLDQKSRSILVTWLMNLDTYHDNVVKQIRST
jgi:DNA-binding MarR family transcriptional regulator